MAKRKLYAAANRVTLSDLACLFVAVICALFGLEGFLLPNNFLDGGITGISLITRQVTGWPLSALLFLLNIPFILLGRYQISLIFAIKTLGAISLLALLLFFVEIDAVTTDPLLVAVFGGFFLGLGIGLAIRGGGVIDGTEVLALYIARKSHFTIGHIVLGINVAIFLLAAWVFSIESALYAMLTYLSASKTVDFIMHGLDEYTMMQIYSVNNAAILHKVLTRSLKLNITVMQASRGDPSRPDKSVAQPVLQTVISRLQTQQILNVINSIDPGAVVVYHPVTDSQGKV